MNNSTRIFVIWNVHILRFIIKPSKVNWKKMSYCFSASLHFSYLSLLKFRNFRTCKYHLPHFPLKFLIFQVKYKIIMKILTPFYLISSNILKNIKLYFKGLKVLNFSLDVNLQVYRWEWGHSASLIFLVYNLNMTLNWYVTLCSF